MTTNQSPITDPQDGMLPVGELRKQLKPLLLQFIAEYHHGLNELAGHGTAIDQTSEAIIALFTAATNEKLPASGDDALKEQMEDAIDNRRYDKDFPNSLNFKGIQYCVEQLLPLFITAKQTAVAEERARILRDVIGKDEHILEEIDAAGISHKLDRELFTQYQLARNNLRAEMRNVLEGKS